MSSRTVQGMAPELGAVADRIPHSDISDPVVARGQIAAGLLGVGVANRSTNW